MPVVRYIGSKARKVDNVAGTGAVWNGPGDEREIKDINAVAKLLQHADVWELVGDRSVPIAKATPAKEQIVELPPLFEHVADKDGGGVFRLRDADSGDVVDLGVYDDDDLREFARLNYIKVDGIKTLSGDNLRAGIVAAAILMSEASKEK